MSVVAHDPFITTNIAEELGIELLTLAVLAEQADFISLHLPSTDATRGIVNSDFLSSSKPDAKIINTARGDLIDEAALSDALTNGQIGGAGLDVYAEEPPPDTFSLFGIDHVITTPHLGAATNEAQENVALQVAEQMSDFLYILGSP